MHPDRLQMSSIIVQQNSYISTVKFILFVHF